MSDSSAVEAKTVIERTKTVKKTRKEDRSKSNTNDNDRVRDRETGETSDHPCKSYINPAINMNIIDS